MNGEQICRRILSWDSQGCTKRFGAYACSVDAQTFVLPTVGNLVPTLRHSLSSQKTLSKLYPSGTHWLLPLWLLFQWNLHLSGWLPQTFCVQFPSHVESREWQVGGGGVKVLSPWRPKLPEISFQTGKFSRNQRTGIDVQPLAALVKWPSGGESRTTAVLAKKTPGSQTSCPWASEKSRRSQAESRKLV